jgi:hypothetical protein
VVKRQDEVSSSTLVRETTPYPFREWDSLPGRARPATGKRVLRRALREPGITGIVGWAVVELVLAMPVAGLPSPSDQGTGGTRRRQCQPKTEQAHATQLPRPIVAAPTSAASTAWRLGSGTAETQLDSALLWTQRSPRFSP